MGSKNLSIMFTDIKGFTERTSGDTRKGMSKLLAAHDRLLIPVFNYFNGHIVKTIGDAFLVYFESPTDAVLCGVTIQEVLRQHNGQAEDNDKLEVRVAINVGDVEVSDTDVLGEAVNIAARLEAVSEPGEVYFTDAVYQTMNRREAPSSEIGERTFKGIPHPIRIYKVINDPGSDLADTLAHGVKLSDKGPIIEGIRDQLVRRQSMGVKKVVGAIIIAAAAIILWLVITPSAVEKSTEKANKFLAEGRHLEVISIMHPLISDDPSNMSLMDISLKAAELNIDELVKSGKPVEAMAWLEKIVEEKPYLHELNKKKPLIDTIITVKKIQLQGSKSEHKPKALQELLVRHPDSAEVPYEAARMLEGNWWYMTIVWLYETALDRGGYQGDDKIYEFLIKQLSGGRVDWQKFKKTIKILNKYYPEAMYNWAKNEISRGDVITTINALNILEEKKDEVVNDPYFGHLKNLIYGRNSNMHADFAFFQQVKDPAKRNHLLALHKEIIDTFPKFTSYGSVKDTLNENLAKLEKEWASSPK